jgi:hypothetical protein
MEKKKIGFAAFFHDFAGQDVPLIYEEYITKPEFMRYPNEVKDMRNKLIYFASFQIVASLLAMCYIIFRRSFLYLFINIATLALAVCGVHGSLSIDYTTLLIHCTLTTSITTGFFLFQLIDFMFAEDTRYGDDKRVNDGIILMIFSLPYIYDLFVGIYNYQFIKKLAALNTNSNINNQFYKELNTMNKNDYTNEEIENHIKTVRKEICVICMDKERETAMNPCGHVLCCVQCSEIIFRKNPKCPICQRKLQAYTKLIIS